MPVSSERSPAGYELHRKLLLRFRYFRHPWRSQSRAARPPAFKATHETPGNTASTPEITPPEAKPIEAAPHGTKLPEAKPTSPAPTGS